MPKAWVSSLDGVTVQKLEEKLAFQQGILRSLHVDQAMVRADVERGREALTKLEKTRERLDKLRERATVLKTSLIEPKEKYVNIGSRLTDATIRVKQIRVPRSERLRQSRAGMPGVFVHVDSIRPLFAGS